MNMNTDPMKAGTLHDEIVLLLPWYVNGTLRGDERVRVEDHLHSCIVCRRELAAERRTLKGFHREGVLNQSAQVGFERLQQRISGTCRHPRGAQPGAGEWFAGWVARMVRSLSAAELRPALIAVPLAAAVLAVALVNLAPKDSAITEDSGIGGTGQGAGRYYTLSNAGVSVSDNDDIHVVFAAGIGPATIRVLLASIPAQIVEGPNSVGAYTIRLGKATSVGEREAVIAGLRERPEVLFAEAAQPMAVPQPNRGRPQ